MSKYLRLQFTAKGRWTDVILLLFSRASWMRSLASLPLSCCCSRSHRPARSSQSWPFWPAFNEACAQFELTRRRRPTATTTTMRVLATYTVKKKFRALSTKLNLSFLLPHLNTWILFIYVMVSSKRSGFSRRKLFFRIEWRKWSTNKKHPFSSQVALSMVTTRHTLPPSSSSGATNVYDQVKSFECCIIENVNVFRLLEAVVAI